MQPPWIFFGPRAKETSSRWMLAQRISESNYVIFVGRPVSAVRQPLHFPLGQRLHLNPQGPTKMDPLHTPERIPGFRPWLRGLNRKRMVRELRELSGASPRIACYTSPSHCDLVGELDEELSLYLAVDDYTLSLTGAPIRGEAEAEQKLLAKIDVAVCVTPLLAERLRGRAPSPHGFPIFVLPNGYDERIFNPLRRWPEPCRLRNISRPRILVSGHISERIDWEMIFEASRLRPSWMWIFLGPADRGLKEKINRHLHPRAFYFPPVAAVEIPAWIQHCEVCAAPYRLNSFTLTSDPLKVIEYLAMGAPTISTRIPSLARYGDAILWVEEGIGSSLADALDRWTDRPDDEDTRRIRRQAVVLDTWTLRVEQFRQIVDFRSPRRISSPPAGNWMESPLAERA